MTLPELKNLSGHRSDTVVYQYIANSDRMRLHAADALAVSSIPTVNRTAVTDTQVHAVTDVTNTTLNAAVTNSPTPRTYSFNNCTFGDNRILEQL